MMSTKTCRTCILPETSLFPLDASGNCKLCNSPSLLKHIVKKPDLEELERLIAQIKQNGKNRDFDCIVGWSGGRDSTFMIHELVRKYNLRCAAVFGRTPFTPIEITDNVHAIADKLDIKLVEIETPANHREIAGYCLKKYLETRTPILINLACASCKFINREIFRQAKRLSIKTIIYGGNRYEYFPSGPASIDIDSENRYSFANMLRDNFLRLAKGVKVLAASPALFKHLYTFFAASVLYVNQYTVFLRLRYPGIILFDYYHYADWDEGKMLEVLKNLEWQLPPGCNSTWRADCVFEAVKNTAFKNQLGFSYGQAMYSNLIRAGKITREEAFARLEKESISELRLHEALKLCGLPEDSFDDIKSK